MEFQKRKSKIFVLSGKAKSGKNTVAKLISEYYGTQKCISISYARYLKDYAKMILSWDGSESSKPRDFLQQLGIELIRNQIDPNLLIRRVKEDIEVLSYFFDVILITDARLIEEIQMPRENFSNVFVIRIEGKDSQLTEIQKNHYTEINLDRFQDFDVIIQNDSTEFELKKKIKSYLDEIERVKL